MPPRHATCLLSMAIAALVAGGCGSGGHSASSASTARRSGSTDAAAYYARDRGNAQFAMGTTVVISDSGFRPLVLLAPLGRPIVWRNVSSHVESVHLDNFGSPVDSGPIKPGGMWSFDPKAQLSITYHSTYPPHFRGQLQVQLVGNQ